ncbi:MAG TPA: hypothetical protein VET69_07100 [Terriglobales bacterium]|nr:hypothetical protein [Terriglobales bacterium]
MNQWPLWARLQHQSIGGMIVAENGRSGAMKFRVFLWAFAGFLVAAGWAVYAAATFPDLIQAKPLVWNLALLTQPIAWASMHFSFPASMYLVFTTNAVAYALVGLIIGSLRRRLSHAR